MSFIRRVNYEGNDELDLPMLTNALQMQCFALADESQFDLMTFCPQYFFPRLSLFLLTFLHGKLYLSNSAQKLGRKS